MYIYMWVHIAVIAPHASYVSAHVCMYVYMWVHIAVIAPHASYVRANVCMYVLMYVCMVCIQVCAHSTDMHINTCTFMHVYTHAAHQHRTYLFIHAYIHPASLLDFCNMEYCCACLTGMCFELKSCMCVCVCVGLHIYILVMHACIHTARVWALGNMEYYCACWTGMCFELESCTHTYIHTHTHIYIYIYTHTYLYMHACIQYSTIVGARKYGILLRMYDWHVLRVKRSNSDIQSCVIGWAPESLRGVYYVLGILWRK
jgi:hypothetical protein